MLKKKLREAHMDTELAGRSIPDENKSNSAI